MNVREYLLITLMEECNEVAQRCSKALRFGLQEVQDTQSLTNEQRIIDELCDLRGVVMELQARGSLLGLLDTRTVNKKTLAKREKLSLYMKYSSEQGCLSLSPFDSRS